MRGARRRLLAGALAGLAAASCAPRARPLIAPLPPTGEACAILPGRATPGGAITVALADPVAPYDAPVPTNDSERLVFRHLYETLVAVDCEGRLRPGLACSWTGADSGRVWIFTLDPNAAFWDGSPVWAEDVKASWRANRGRGRGTAPGAGAPGIAWMWVDPASDSVAAVDERRLAVRLLAAIGGTPALFADPALAVARPEPGRGWPLGTGACRVAAGGDAGTRAGDLVCLPSRAPGAGLEPPRWERLGFRTRPGEDPRDLHAEGADALVVRDRSLVAYFAAVPAFEVVPLPWDRLYVLLTPRAAAGGPALELEEEDLAALARDAVAAEAAPAPSLLFAGDPAGPDAPCPFASAAGGRVDHGLDPIADREAGRPLPQRIVYAQGDPDAKRLAERLAALGSGRVAAGLPPDAFGAAAAAGSEMAYVASIARHRASGCLALATLFEMAPWLHAALAGAPEERSAAPMEWSAARIASRLTTCGAVLPLVVTRAHLAARRGLAAAALDGDGTLRFEGAGWAAGAPADPASPRDPVP